MSIKLSSTEQLRRKKGAHKTMPDWVMGIRGTAGCCFMPN